MMQVQLKPVELKFIEQPSLSKLAEECNKFLERDWVLHGVVIDKSGGYAQGLVRLEAVPIGPPPGMAGNILIPRPG